MAEWKCSTALVLISSNISDVKNPYKRGIKKEEMWLGQLRTSMMLIYILLVVFDMFSFFYVIICSSVILDG